MSAHATTTREGQLLAWEPLSGAQAEQATRALAREVARWDGTPYAPGQQCCRVAVDCVRYVAAIVDRLSGKSTPIETLPPDTAFHDPVRALEGMRRLRELYQPNVDVTGQVLQPGDVLCVGPVDGGPGHAMLVGPEPCTLWHSGGRGVHMTGIHALVWMRYKVFAAYRLERRDWK